MKNNKLSLKKLVIIAIIVAVKLCLSSVAIGPAYFKLGFAFLGSVALGYLVGPWWGAVGGFSSGLVHFIVFGDKANFLFASLLSASLTPLIYGLFLYKYPLKFWRVVVAQLAVSVLINIGLTNFLYAWQNGLSIEVAFIQRLPKEMLLPWGQMLLSYLLLCYLVRIKSKVINFNS
ncbi:ECF transporter S component [Lactobacillus psittaci]|uniref:ECF transporter S component n=1 Tax=Lactobacillus psittaci TaxID=116089 RepID=UPI00040933B8|nr:ECF transporter S component [Lactobacillus psittaci]